VQHADRTNINGVDDDDKKLIWPAKYVIAWAIPFFIVASGLAVWTVVSVWAL
jgi:hypothetical protein